MADQLAGQWYADVTGLGDLLPADRVDAALRTIHAHNVCRFGGGRMGAVNGMRPDGIGRRVERAVGRGVGRHDLRPGRVHDRPRASTTEGWETARGAAEVTYERGLWFRTPEAYDENGDFRASIYLRPLAIWAIEEALRRRRSEPRRLASAAEQDPGRREDQPVQRHGEPRQRGDVGSLVEWGAAGCRRGRWRRRRA